MGTREPRQRLSFLDGLRGLACLYVLLFHELGVKVEGASELGWPMRTLRAWFGQGHFSVVFFIVLSGFSLMLPVVRSESGDLAGGFTGYMRRRARRILPPYYAAVILSLASILIFNELARRQGVGQPIEAALSTGSIVSHLLLVHNFAFDWAYRINGPLWSVATEWHIYFVFALLLLPLWRKAGSLPVVLVAWAVGCLPQLLLSPDENFFWAAPWFLGSFALGIWGADIGFSPRHENSWLRNRAPWATLSVAFLAAIVVIVSTGRADTWPLPATDFFVSMFAFCIINACVARSRRSQQKSWMLEFFGSRTLAYIGGFSYSLYLVQHPLLRLSEKMVGRLSVSYESNLQIHLVFVTPLVIALAWIFAEVFERPFTTGGVLLPALGRRLGVASAIVSPKG